MAKPIPDGYHTVTPYLTVRAATKVIEFLKQAFGAKLSHEAIRRPDGSIMHAQVLIGDSRIMIAEESEMAKATTSTRSSDSASHAPTRWNLQQGQVGTFATWFGLPF